MFSSKRLSRSGCEHIQLKIVVLTQVASSFPALRLLDTVVTSAATSCINPCSLLKCRCINQVNLFSQPLYSLSSMRPSLSHRKEASQSSQPLAFDTNAFTLLILLADQT